MYNPKEIETELLRELLADSRQLKGAMSDIHPSRHDAFVEKWVAENRWMAPSQLEAALAMAIRVNPDLTLPAENVPPAAVKSDSVTDPRKPTQADINALHGRDKLAYSNGDGIKRAPNAAEKAKAAMSDADRFKLAKTNLAAFNEKQHADKQAKKL